MEIIVRSLHVFSLVGTGMVAGIFFAFSNFIMRAFSKLSNANGSTAMKEVNRTVQNPWFFLFFIGTAITSFLLMIFYFFTPIVSGWSLIGSILYFFGCFMVTGIKNIPLNNQLEALNTKESKQKDSWTHYMRTWTFWNHIRTIACMGAFICLIITLLK
ncbi:DUF1772 domain-containing protein [Marinilactibacillus kalidii]|uniref:anthrone oxygenase family protein n=1 Tax=Marinilactibacillus kalidii TaxID=2820274 RepID=UPI001ABE0F4F|nr:anthrone oxygenase family protein [Marinilactibacillus kalidii]